jgi:hypothetical protein
MRYTPPISDDKWDSWEPLVGGLPFFLRLILLQYAFAIVASTFLLLGCLKWFLGGRPGPPSSGTVRAVIVSSGVAVYGLLVWSWREAYEAKKWAIGFLGILSFVLTLVSVALLLTLPAQVTTDAGVIPVALPMAVVAPLAAVEGVYLFRLRAKLKRLGLP